MRNRITMTALVSGLMAMLLIDGAAAGQSSSPGALAEQHSSRAVLPSHAVGGVVKVIDATRLVITRAGKKPAEMTFELRPSTQRQGMIVVGVSVQVRYRAEAGSQVATAIVAAPPRARP